MKKHRYIIEEIICGILMVIVLAAVTIQIGNRLTVKASLPWTEELARYCFVWMAYLGVSLGVKRGKHMNVDLINNVISPKAGNIIGIICDLLFAGMCFYIIIYGYKFVAKLYGFGQKSGGMAIEMWVLYAAAPVGMVMTLCRIVEKNLLLFRKKGREGRTAQ
ncbi:MAG: TRAP transporter small permease [Clostridiales bacterium]